MCPCVGKYLCWTYHVALATRMPETAVACITDVIYHVFTTRKYRSPWIRTGRFLLSKAGIKYWLFVLKTMSCKYDNAVVISPQRQKWDDISNLMRYCHACVDDRSLQRLIFVHSHEYINDAQPQMCCKYFITLLIVRQHCPTTFALSAFNVFASHLNENNASVLDGCGTDSILGMNA